MLRSLIFLLVAGTLIGCQQPPVIQPIQMDHIYFETMENTHQFSLYRNEWYYAGSHDGFDHVVHSSLHGLSTYRIKEGRLSIRHRFPMTRDQNEWIRFEKFHEIDSNNGMLMGSDYLLDKPTGFETPVFDPLFKPVP